MSDTSAGSGMPNLGDHAEPQGASLGARLNWLRAAVLGANDGIVSTAGVVVGVAGATSDRGSIIIAGVAAAVAGALSMAAGEYVSVSTQRDSERAMLHLERRELHEDPEGELEELTQLYEAKGISRHLAEEVAKELTDHDALAAHAEVELGIDPDELTNPWHAAGASMAAFTVGALLPMLMILLPSGWRIGATAVSVAIALGLTGFLSARFAQADVRRAIIRNVVGGVLAMAVTYGIGSLVGATVV
jgi:VIT1/CCC1 family predicted Fe2+/Mn2+ transporter